ncbi:unnamed protein product [Pelagomonas calceolata]|uniref:Exostosin GT47 domain-containing protein n=1 Tax=Pelagomonas calceolata TaxID=35677 RepID=A0A8J2SU46_9STRA|nr:unnamed protein product [Pelagomonas calceolata]
MTRLVLLAAAAAAGRFCKDFHSPRPETLYKLLRTVPEHVLAVDKLRTGPHHKERESVTALAAKCCSVYPGQTGARAERVKGDVAFVAVHFKQFAAFFARAWPALEQRNQNFVLYTFGNDDNMPWEFFQCHGLGTDRLRAFLGAPQLRGWFTQNLDAARSRNKRRGHSKCADGLMRSWPKYDADLDATLRAKLHFVPIGIKILTGRTGDGCAAARTLDALRMSRPPFARRSPRILVALGTAGPNRDRRAEVVKLLSGRPDVAHVVEGHLDQDEFYRQFTQFQFVAAPGSHGQDTYPFWEAVALGAVPVTLRGPLDGLYSKVPCVLVDDWRPITPADLVAWRQNLTERFGDLDAATRTARRTVLNSTFWAEQIRAMA